MEKIQTSIKKNLRFIVFLIPLVLILAFYPLRGCRAFMNLWVFEISGPFQQFLGRVFSVFPFSVLEFAALFAIAVTLYKIVKAFYYYFKNKNGKNLFKRLFALLTFWLYAAAAFYYLWNTTYYADSFSERSNLEVRPYYVNELAEVTDYFALKSAELSKVMSRDENGMWNESLNDCIERSPDNYKNIQKIFPALEMQSVKVKPFALSKFHSVLGFTGMYTPYTGEANINVDAPAFLIPSTICHEMTHQRMVASEAECNFVGITACIVSDDPVYQYSGYMSGLIHLCNALYPASPELWHDIVEKRFTKEMQTDWNYNNAYWRKFESPVGDAADTVYDHFLKSNDQELGRKSYGACVDLLINWFLPIID